jgi:hypothetical protein
MAEMSLAFNLIYNGINRADIRTFTVLNGVNKSLSYNFKVLAINDVGESQESPVLTCFIAVVPSAPLGFK